MSDSSTLNSVARQAPLSMKLSRQGHRSGLPCPSPGDLPDPGVRLRSPSGQADSLPLEPPRKLPANEKEEVKSVQIWKGENKIVFAEDMIVCVESIYSYNIT